MRQRQSNIGGDPAHAAVEEVDESVADLICAMGTVTAPAVTFLGVDPEIAKRLNAIVLRLQRLEEERDQLILRAREEGASLREIAQHAGMTHVGIKKLIGRHLHPDWQRALNEELPDEPE